MEHRHLGRSGLRISEIAYGNWLTHGSQVEEDAAKECVAAALDGIRQWDADKALRLSPASGYGSVIFGAAAGAAAILGDRLEAAAITRRCPS